MNNDWGTSQNELEAALMHAATDPAARPAFYKALAGSQLLIVPAGPTPLVEDGVLKEAATLQLAQIEIQGQRCIPLFTSEARLPQGTRYLSLASRDLFNITKGATLVLNPGAQYGKMLVPDEIRQLLDGSLFKPSETFTVKNETKGLIGQPKDYPHEFVAALKRYFATESSVEKAYLANTSCLAFIQNPHWLYPSLHLIVSSNGLLERLALLRRRQKSRRTPWTSQDTMEAKTTTLLIKNQFMSARSEAS